MNGTEPKSENWEQPVLKENESNAPARDWRFWCIILAIAVSNFTSNLDFAVSTALPVIAHDLHASDFVWVGSAYALSSTAILPLSGGMAQAFGRRPVLLASILCFALGSALSGAAHTMNFLIGGRTVQGIGAGGIFALTQVVLSDLVPLKERGAFNGLLGIAAMLAVCVAPVIAGSLADKDAWRWLFYLNLFASGLSASLVFLFLRLKTPPGTIMEKLSKIDLIGNAIVISSTSSTIIALTWAGIQFPWSSFRVLVPLCLGLVGLAAFILYDYRFAKHPIVPFSLMKSRTALSGYLQNFILYIVLFMIVYYLPVYLQASKGVSPTRAGVLLFGLSFTVSPFGLIGGISVTKLKFYRSQMWLAWALIMIAMGCMTTVKADTSLAKFVGYEIIAGSGIGILTTTTYFPVLAPIPVTANAQALAFFMFVRSFGQIWGITVGATILQNQLLNRLPASFSAQFPQGTSIAFEVIPLIPTLADTLKAQVEEAFAASTDVIWQTTIGIAGAGLLAGLLMRHLPLHTETDKQWGYDEAKGSQNMSLAELNPDTNGSA